MLHCAVLAGPHTRQRTDALMRPIWAAQGFGRVATSADIAREAARLLADPKPRARGGRCGGARRGQPGGRGGAHRGAALKSLLDARA